MPLVRYLILLLLKLFLGGKTNITKAYDPKFANPVLAGSAAQANYNSIGLDMTDTLS